MKRPVLVLPMILLFSFILLAQEATCRLIGQELSPMGENNDERDEVCVTLEKFESGCSGHVQATNTFTALKKPGSPCKHTAHMKNNSAKDQYCTFQSGTAVFHQTVYVHNTQCKVSWEGKAISPIKLTYTAESCTYGYKLKSCTLGPCQESPDASTDLESVSD
jgi:hypothetical protein